MMHLGRSFRCATSMKLLNEINEDQLQKEQLNKQQRDQLQMESSKKEKCSFGQTPIPRALDGHQSHRGVASTYQGE